MKMRMGMVALVGFSAFLEGCPSCPYEEACDGNVLKYCYLGIDQLVGSPDEGERACAEPNPTCITVDARRAVCGIAKERTCDPETPTGTPHCIGKDLITCDSGYDSAYDCAAHGNVCDAVKCRRDPAVACASTSFQTRCEGTHLIECAGTVEVSTECALVYPLGTCATSTNDYGTSSYCKKP